MKKVILLSLILISIIFVSGCIYDSSVEGPAKDSTNKIDTIACQDDAKICPDGSSVSRISPDCEFEECPLIGENCSDACLSLEYGLGHCKTVPSTNPSPCLATEISIGNSFMNSSIINDCPYIPEDYEPSVGAGYYCCCALT